MKLKHRREMAKCGGLKNCAVVYFAFICIPSLFGQSTTQSAPPIGGWVGQLDIYAKVFGGVVAGLGALFGLPIAVLSFKKTRAEIRKLELEAAALEGKAAKRGFAAALAR